MDRYTNILFFEYPIFRISYFSLSLSNVFDSELFLNAKGVVRGGARGGLGEGYRAITPVGTC